MRHNKISGGSYVEPYAGGAGAALYLLSNQYVRRIFINDLDPVIHAFWYAVLKTPDELTRLIKKTPVTIKMWQKQKEIIENPAAYSPVEVGFATFFLNRVNRSGILKAGVIGGINQDGNYKIDARYNKDDLISRIEAIAQQKRKISLSNMDAMDFIQDIAPDLEEKSLTYLDPPYFNKGSQLYRNFYEPKDHKKIKAVISKVKTPWIVTYDNCEEIKTIYSGHQTRDFSLIYSTHTTRPRTTEVMIYKNLELPSTPFLSRTNRPYPRKWETLRAG